MNGPDHFNLGYLNHTHVINEENDSDNVLNPHLHRALQSLPGRRLTDSLVHYAIRSGNYVFQVLQTQAFHDEYDLWWRTKANRQHIDQSFLALLLQVCGCSTQSADEVLRYEIEGELFETVERCSEGLNFHGLLLARSITPGKGGVNLALAFLLAATWQKGEGQIVDAWHTLASAVREEQECGLCLISCRSPFPTNMCLRDSSG